MPTVRCEDVQRVFLKKIMFLCIEITFGKTILPTGRAAKAELGARNIRDTKLSSEREISATLILEPYIHVVRRALAETSNN